jgi:hypothetical protein
MDGHMTTMSHPSFAFVWMGHYQSEFNIPGLVHDSQVVEYGNIYEKLETVYNTT